MVPQVDHTSSVGYELLLFLGAKGVANLRRAILGGYPLSGYGYFASPNLPLYDHPIKWLESKGENMSDFKGKGTPVPKF